MGAEIAGWMSRNLAVCLDKAIRIATCHNIVIQKMITGIPIQRINFLASSNGLREHLAPDYSGIQYLGWLVNI